MAKGIISWQDLAGNAFADIFADKAAEAAALPHHVAAEYDALDAMAWRIQSRIAAIICAAPTRSADAADAAKHKEDKRKLKESQQADELQPQVDENSIDQVENHLAGDGDLVIGEVPPAIFRVYISK